MSAEEAHGVFIAEAHGVWGFPSSSLFHSLKICRTLSEQINVMYQKKGRNQICVNKSFSCWIQQNHFFVLNKKLWIRANWKKQNWNCKRRVYRFCNMAMAIKKKNISICHIDWDMFHLMKLIIEPETYKPFMKPGFFYGLETI